MARDMKDVLLLTILFLGFRLLSGSLLDAAAAVVSDALPSPKVGGTAPLSEPVKPLVVAAVSVDGWLLLLLLFRSARSSDSADSRLLCSWSLDGRRWTAWLLAVVVVVVVALVAVVVVVIVEMLPSF
jgi:hypothetical protein